MKSIIYEYGARLDAETEAETTRQFNLARGLYNECVALITDARKAADEFVRKADSAVAEKMAEIDRLSERFDLAKSVNDEPGMAEAAKARRAAWRELTPLLKAARKTYREEISAFFKGIGRTKECDTYRARCQFIEDGLGSNTADEILDTALKAWDKVRKDGGKLSFRSVKQRQQDHLLNRFTVAGGIEPSALFESCRSVKLTHGQKYGEFQFRLGQAKANTYATGTWHHERPFPDGARVKAVRLVRKTHGERIVHDDDYKKRLPFYRWTLQFHLDVPGYRVIETGTRKPLAALHLGFSMTDDGARRIGAIIENGEPECARFIELPNRIVDNLMRVQLMQERLDKLRDDTVMTLRSLSPNWEPELMDEWAAMLKLPDQHISAARLKRLSIELENRGYTDAIAQTLQAFARTDYWKRNAMTSLRKKTLNDRKNTYRHWALEWVKQYQHIVIGRLNLKDMALRIDKDGERNELGQKARYARHNAALYQLLECIKYAATRAGTVVFEEKDLTYASHCAACGQKFVRETDEFICECGYSAEIKANASAVLHSKWLPIYKEQAEIARQSDLDKAEKAAEKKAMKLERMQAKRRLIKEQRQFESPTLAGES